MRKRATPPAFFKTSVAERLRDKISAKDLALLLTLIDTEDVPAEVIEAWSAERRAVVEDYAIRVHLNASDNCLVRVPQLPPELKPYRK